jgi:DAK2 domain fusion protein YloV
MSEGSAGGEEAAGSALRERFRTIDGRILRALAEAGLSWLRTNQQSVNALNVFPVPDGDTGTNMTLTMQSAWEEIKGSEETSVGKVAHALAHGALMGARGNSGVILSQLWRGLARTLDNLPIMDASTFARALAEARDTAYRGVVHPVEGTILTVSKDAASAASATLQNGASSAYDILEQVVAAADASVQKTPELLPVLKEAGVVDAGGKGLYFLLEGMLRSIKGEPLDKPIMIVQPLSSLALEGASEAVEPGQDWEVVVDFRPEGPLELHSFYRQLETMGTSIQLGEGDGMYRMHIHVPDKTEYAPIDFIRSMGTITNIAIENLMDQMEARSRQAEDGSITLAPVTAGHIGVVTVSPGPGFARVFASLGAAAIVHGGQTMNPSTEEILSACERVTTDKIVILPNNKNITLAARQASELSAKKIAVVPTDSVPQGIAALLAIDPEGELDRVAEAMMSASHAVRSGELTVATRSVEMEGVHVRQGQVIGLLDDRLCAAGDDLTQVMTQLLECAGAGEAELVTMYYGAPLQQEEAEALAEVARKAWPELEVEVVNGGQPHYHLILSIE